MTYTLALALVAALAPAAFAWHSGRRLADLARDPALPELLLARGEKISKVTAGALAVCIVIGGVHALWLIPTALLLRVVVSYPLREALFGETCGLGAFIWYMVRSVVGGMGFWIVLMLAPTMITDFAPHEKLAALVIATVLVLWDWYHHEIWLGAHGGTPLKNDRLKARFAEIVGRAGVRPPAIYRFGMPGMHMANAVALPHPRRPAVGMSDTLLEILTTDEAVAVFAHEVAHLEYYDRRRLLRARLTVWTLIALMVGTPLVLLRVAPVVAPFAPLLIPVVILLTFGSRVKRSRNNETASDLRAAQLCGSADAMASALTKLHVASRVPRRWPHEMERAATHPSFARRIQALRAAEGVHTDTAWSEGSPTSPLVGPVLVRGAVPGALVVLDARRAYWFEGVPEGTPHLLPALRERATSYRAAAYGDLTELRVTADAAGRALQATDRQGNRWVVPLNPDDVAAAQRALDVVDSGLNTTALRDAPAAARALGVLGVIALIVAQQYGLALVAALLVLWRPGAASLAALGAMSLARVALSLALGGLRWRDAWELGGLVALTAVGAVALWMAWGRARAAAREPGSELARGPSANATLAALAAVVVLSALWAAGGVRGATMASLPAYPAVASVAVALLALAAAAATVPRRAARRAATVGAVAALVPLVTAAAGDALSPGGIAWEEVSARETGRVILPPNTHLLELSPKATHWAVRETMARGATRWRWLLGDWKGGRDTLDGDHVAFVDETRLITFENVTDSSNVRLVRLGSHAPVWRVKLPPVVSPRLFVDSATRRWTLVGRSDEEGSEGSPVAFSGRLDKPSVDTLKLVRRGEREYFGEPMYAEPDGAVIASTYGGAGSDEGSGIGAIPFVGMPSSNWDVWRIDGAGRKRIASLPGMPRCVGHGAGEAICTTLGGRGRIWRLAPDGVRPAGAFPSGVLEPQPVGTGWVGGASFDGARVVLVDGQARRGWLVTLPMAGRRYVMGIRSEAGRLALLRTGRGPAELTIYDMH